MAQLDFIEEIPADPSEPELDRVIRATMTVFGLKQKISSVRWAFPRRSTHPPPFVRYHSPGPHKLGITPALLMAQILGNKTQNPAINML